MEQGGGSEAAGSAATRGDGADGHGEGSNNAGTVAGAASRATVALRGVAWRPGMVVVACEARRRSRPQGELWCSGHTDL